MGGPVYGHVMTVGGFAGLSHASEQAPGRRRGIGGDGVVAGRAALARGAHVLRQDVRLGRDLPAGRSTGSAPRRPATDVHVWAAACPSDWMNVSGAQKPGRPVAHAARELRLVGRRDERRPARSARRCTRGCTPGTASDSMSGGPVYGHVGPPPPSPAVRLPPSPQMTLSMLHAPVGVLVSGSMHGTQSSPWPQVSGLSRLTCELPETRVMHSLRQTPCSVHVRSFVVHGAGTYSLPAWMMGSGTQQARAGRRRRT